MFHSPLRTYSSGSIARGGNDEDAPPIASLDESQHVMALDSDAQFLMSPVPATPSNLFAPPSSSSVKRPAELPTESSSGSWVTVFGFSTEQYQSILSHFEHLGGVVNYEHGPPGSNWVHLQYQLHLHYEAALTKNGTIFQGSMIGVIPKPEKAATTTGTKLLPPSTPSLAHRLTGARNPTLLPRVEQGNEPELNTSFWHKFLEYTFGL